MPPAVDRFREQGRRLIAYIRLLVFQVDAAFAVHAILNDISGSRSAKSGCHSLFLMINAKPEVPPHQNRGASALRIPQLLLILLQHRPVPAFRQSGLRRPGTGDGHQLSQAGSFQDILQLLSAALRKGLPVFDTR